MMGLKMAVIAFIALISMNLLQCIHGAPLSSYLVSSFTSPDPDLPFNNITTYNVTGDIYIGADRRLYQLDSNLTLKQSAVVQCSGDPDDSLIYNKLLVIAPSPVDKLISCWNCGDYCETRSLVDITFDIEHHSDEKIAPPDVPMVGIVTEDAHSKLSLFTGRSYRNTGTAINPVIIHSLNPFVFKKETNIYKQIDLEKNDYVQSIHLKDFIYYIINRLKSPDLRYIPLGRLCPKTLDPNLESYTEIELACVNGNTSYKVIRAAHIGPAGAALSHSMGLSSEENILYAVFTKDDSSSEESALCIYRMDDVQQSFNDTVTGCVKDNSYKNTFLQGSECGACKSFIDDPLSYECNAYAPGLFHLCAENAYAYASSRDPLRTAPLLTWTGSAPTSIIIDIEREHTIAVVGDEGGKITKIHISNSSSTKIYETIDLGSGSVLKDMFLHEEDDEITVGLSSTVSVLENKVVRLSIANCSQYRTCEECAGVGAGNPGDPYCGWCTLESRCSRFVDCDLSTEPSRWLSYNDLECVNISDIQPTDSLPYYMTEQQVTLTVEELPGLRDSYQYNCVFDSYITIGSTVEMTVSCETPPASNIPEIPVEEDHVAMELSIKSNETDVEFVSRDFYFYDCSKIKSCFPCVSSRWACDWCVYDNRCTHNNTSCQAGEVIVTEEMGIESCPQVLNVSGEVYIPVDIPSSLTLVAKNLPTNKSQVQGYECVLHIEGQEQVTPSTLFNETFLVCNAQEYTYQEDILMTDVAVSVRWNDQNMIDNTNDIQVTLYKCSANDDSCSRCLSPDATPTQLRCFWCGDICDVIESGVCQSPLNQSQSNQCSPPVITSFFPLSGPKEGNTRIEVTGTDLGVRFQDVRMITVAGRECNLTGMDQYYQPGLSISCLTMAAEAGISGIIEVEFMSGEQTKRGESQDKFTYTNPSITEFSPMEGPVAGGTRVTITGEFLDTGRDQRAWFGFHECRNLSFEGNLSCITTVVDGAGHRTLTMTFDGVARRESADPFSFMPNPVINQVDKTVSISAGGRVIGVTGTGFQLIQETTIRATSYSSNITTSELCNVMNDTLLECPTPENPDRNISRKRRATGGINVSQLTFDMDGFIVFYNNITYHPDPFYFNISEPNRIAYIGARKELKINGTDLNLASEENDVVVKVGVDGECDVILLEPTFLQCILPKNQPEADTNDLAAGGMKELPSITVIHGNLRFYPGYVEYEINPSNVGLIVGCVVGFVVLVVIILVIAGVVITKRRQTSIMQQAGELELVEKKIKKKVEAAFHDLQLDMSEVEEQVRHLGIPFVNTREYTRNMLFSGLERLPATTDPELMDENLERAMIMFSRQLNNPDFLISFIHQLEEKRKTQRRDRVNIASLITIVLMTEGKFDYFTQTLKMLLEEQISDASETGRLRALFRRTETIVEKLLSNWMSICMYQYLKTNVAKSLYLLYQSIKVQVEKGPIDIITGQSYFSLNFDCLLDEDVDYNELTLSVVGKNGQHEYYVKVVDVDCITQVKQKILDAAYRKKHLVRQNRAHEMDLLWYHPGGEEKILRDRDEFNAPTDKGMTVHINMVKNFGISDNDRVALIEMTQNTNKGTNNYTLISPGTSMFYIYWPSDVRERDQTRIQSNQEAGHQLWHLVPEDQMQAAEQSKTKLDKEFSAPQFLVTKRTIEPFLEEFLANVFEKPDQTPLSIKHLFDFFYKMASRYCSENPGEYAEAWKSNSLPQHYWMTTLTHPSYIFNMRQSRSADQSVSVLANMLDGACKKIKQEKTQDSSLNRVLFVKNLQEYIKIIGRYYEDISHLTPPSKAELRDEYNTIGEEFRGLFSRVGTLKELYDFTCQDTADLLDSITEMM